MAGNGPSNNTKLSKILAKKNKGGGKGVSSGRNSRNNSINAVQTLDHRLVYLNPKERARRDLETRHGQNMVQLANVSAERLNSTLEA